MKSIRGCAVETLGKDDRLFRFGGEEFVTILNDTMLRQANGAFERFRVALEDSPPLRSAP